MRLTILWGWPCGAAERASSILDNYFIYFNEHEPVELVLICTPEQELRTQEPLPYMFPAAARGLE